MTEQQRHEYDSEKRGIEIRTPLKEVGGEVYKGGWKMTIITRKSASVHLSGSRRSRAARG
ncbi:hypothetical protein [Amycolatopsis sp. NPDC098790]|uniref:hypothetical protein n=1 Tax=Amycolatopsis sp. NPDC098790 TaxID=3363939 RepID=UPI0038228E4C